MESVFGRIVDGRYALVEKLGEGGMGQVYRALDGLTRDQVALKQVQVTNEQVLAPARVDDSDGLRLALAQEFHTLASLRHPNIISVLDYGFDNNQPFYTMDLLSNAQSILDAAAGASLETRINLLVQLLQAIAYLHRRGIIHRDLKPGNVLVIDGYVKVLDFGLSIAEDTISVGDNVLVGTPAYIAPEVLLGEPARETADLYAIGVMAYEMLTGHHPFDTATIGRLFSDTLTREPDLSELENLDALAAPPEDEPRTPGVGTSTIRLEPETFLTQPIDEVAPFIMDPPTPAGGWAAAGITLANIVGNLLAKNTVERYQSAETVIDHLLKATRFPIPTENQAIRESYLRAARFVGRERELNQLASALKQAEQRQGSAWLIGGESGIGKTRLLEELRIQALVSGFMVLRGQAVADGGLAYQLWREPARRLALGTELSDLDAGILKDIVPEIDELQNRAIPPVADIEGVAHQQRLVGTIASLFQRQQRPILLVLEDLQWTRESLDVLKPLIGLTPDLALMIVASYRDDEAPDLPQKLPGMNLLKLERLSSESITTLSVSMLGEAGRQNQIQEFLQRESEGNVFFIVEVVRVLAEEAGRLDRVGRISLPKFVTAGGIQAVVERRLSRVPPEGLELLRMAALAGRELDLKVLEHLKGSLNLEEWLIICANCAVLEVQGEQWRFSHDKLRTTAIETIPADQRPGLHRRVAEAIEAAYPDSPEQAYVIAQHWRSAGDPVKERAYLQRAGVHALDVSAFTEAVTSFRRILELMDASADPQDTPLRAEMLQKLGETLKYQGDYETAAAHLDEALALRRALGEPEGIAAALLELGDLVIYLGDYPRAWQLCEEGLNLYRGLSDAAGTAQALDRLGLVRFHQGDYAGAIQHCQEGLALSRQIDDHRRIASAINNLGMAAFAQGNYADATRYFEETLALCQESGERRKAAAALLNLGSAAGELRDYDSANRRFEESLAIFRTIGERRGVALALDNLGVIAEFQMDYPRATRFYEESLALARAIGNKRGIGSTLVNLGNVARAQNHAKQATQFYLQGMQQAREIEVVPTLLEGLTGLAAFQTDARTALRWLGLILNHPAAFEGTRKLAEPILERLKPLVEAGEFDGLLAEGKNLDLIPLVDSILAGGIA
jgi:serine/threonine protein kinase/tetratricopeptide (TPR) repeat protein